MTQPKSGSPKNINLIVDFPAHGRPRRSIATSSTSDEITSSSNNNNSCYTANKRERQSSSPRSVRFADANSILVIDRPDDFDAKLSWNTSGDYRAFRRALRADVKSTSEMVAEKPQDQVTNDDLIQFVGIETCLSESLLKRTVKRREKHIHSVLAEQQRQEKLNIHDSDLLGCVSEMSSKWSVNRAAAIGHGYWEME
mmetsp:Transcript_16801/g.32778  ORF Transcript_16801/g.32778 Transcript_16801/m.32778 type:complete len:197 (-) Transcript_16801:200-790(-)